VETRKFATRKLEKKKERKPAIRWASLKNSLKAGHYPTKSSDLLEAPSATSLTTPFATGKNYHKKPATT
jgi:hypothetical protein